MISCIPTWRKKGSSIWPAKNSYYNADKDDWAPRIKYLLFGQQDVLHKTPLLRDVHVPHMFSSVQFLRCVWLFATPWTAACQASLSITNSQSILNSRPLSWWCHPAISSSVVLFSSCLQSFPASGSFLMSQLHQVAKVLEFQFQH